MDDIRDMFAQIMRNTKKPWRKTKGVSNKKQYYKDPYSQEEKVVCTILTISIPINHPLNKIISLEVPLILQSLK